METLTKFITPGIIFLVTLASGFWLSSLGKPYNGIIFNLHKLVALAVVIVTAIQVTKTLKLAADPQALVVILLVLAGACIVALFATGALLSLGKLEYGLMLFIHRAALILLPVSMAGMLYLMAGSRL